MKPFKIYNKTNLNYEQIGIIIDGIMQSNIKIDENAISKIYVFKFVIGCTDYFCYIYIQKRQIVLTFYE